MKTRTGIIAAILIMLFTLTAHAGPKDDKLWIVRLDNGFQVTVPDLDVKETHPDPAHALEMAFAGLNTIEQEIFALNLKIEALQAEIETKKAQAVMYEELKPVYELGKTAATLFTRQTMWTERFGPIIEVAITGLMNGRHRVAFAWARMHPE